MLKINFKTLFTIALMLPSIGMAYLTKAQTRELDRKIFKTEQHLKNVISRDLKLAIGVKELLVNVKIEVSKNGVYREITGLDEQMKKIEGMQLPSLFINSDQQKKLKEIKEITIDHVLGHIQKISLSISTPYEVVDEEAMREEIKSVLNSNYNRAKQIELTIIFNKTKQALVDTRKNTLSGPNYQLIVEEFKKVIPYLLWLLVSLVVVMGGFLLLFKKSMKQVTSALDDIEVKGNFTANLPAPPKAQDLLAGPDRKALPRSSGGESTISSYIELVDKIRYLAKENKELLHEMISLHFHIGEIQKNLILLNILETEEREEYYASLPSHHLKILQNYIINEGELLYQDEVLLNDIAKEIFRVISIANVKPESFYQIYLKKVIHSLSSDEVANVIRACSSKELMYFLDNVDGVKLAFVCENHDLGDIKFNKGSVTLNAEETKKFVHKLAKFIFVKDAVVEGNAKAELIPHLGKEMEEKYIASMGLPVELSFDNLVKLHFEVVLEFVKKLELEDIKDLICLFDDEKRQKLISQLPEVIAERVKLKVNDPNENTFALKIKLYKELKTNHETGTKESVQKVNDKLEYLEKRKQLSHKKDSDDVA